jgi:hypothetical protein
MIRAKLQPKNVLRLLVTGLAVLTLASNPLLAAKKKQPPEESHDGLRLRPNTEVALAYVKPGADFSGYDKVMILEAYVAFKKGWERDQRAKSVTRITKHDMQKIKEATAELFREVFAERLSADDGYPVVDSPDTDVLLLRPAIIDLEVTAPDVPTARRSYSFASSAGAATLYLELYDSVSGEILARVIDRKAANYPGELMRWSNRVVNQEAARRVLAGWADLLRARLDEIHAVPEVVRLAVADLAARVGTTPGQIEVRSFEEVTWPDTSLGCPEPGMVYAQMVVRGWRIVLVADNETFSYHAGDRPEPFLCEQKKGLSGNDPGPAEEVTGEEDTEPAGPAS